MLKLYNTMSRSKEVFKSISEGKVGLYSCGPTRKIYKPLSVFSVSNFRIVSMLPGDLRVTRCFIFSGGFDGSSIRDFS